MMFKGLEIDDVQGFTQAVTYEVPYEGHTLKINDLILSDIAEVDAAGQLTEILHTLSALYTVQNKYQHDIKVKELELREELSKFYTAIRSKNQKDGIGVQGVDGKKPMTDKMATARLDRLPAIRKLRVEIMTLEKTKARIDASVILAEIAKQAARSFNANERALNT